MRVAWAMPGILLGILALSASTLPGQSRTDLRLVSPRQGAIVRGTVPIIAEAAENLEISFVIFGIDGNKPLATNTRPFSCSWDTRDLVDGPHIILVQAYGPGGLIASTGPIQVIVRNQAPAARQPLPRKPTVRRVPPLLPAPAHKPIVQRAVSPLPPQASLAAHPAARRPALSVLLDGRPLAVPVRVQGGESYLQVRPVVEQMGGSVAWEQSLHRTTVLYGEREVRLTVGSKTATLNGARVELWRVPRLESDRMVLPARSYAQILDFPVVWDAVRRVILLGMLPAHSPAG